MTNTLIRLTNTGIVYNIISRQIIGLLLYSTLHRSPLLRWKMHKIVFKAFIDYYNIYDSLRKQSPINVP